MSDKTVSRAIELRRTKRVAFVAALVVVLVGLDHLTKWLAVVYLKEHPPIIYLGDLFRLQYATNTGAFLSLGAGLPEHIRPWLLTGLNGVILSVVAMFLIAKRQIPFLVTLALALILSGGVGNMIDRIFRDGVVVDFMNIGMPWGPLKIRSGIFNIADIAIMAGLFLMIGIELFAPSDKKKEAATPSDEKAAEK